MFIGFLVAMLERRGATQVIFDKDRGLEILVRALGGEYLPLQQRRRRPDSIRCSCRRRAATCRVPESLAAHAGAAGTAAAR